MPIVIPLVSAERSRDLTVVVSGPPPDGVGWMTRTTRHGVGVASQSF
jgi:hypothetical protein